MLTSVTSTSIASVGANPIGVLAAFGAGILSFLSPCVLPLVPGYLSVVSGLSASELRERREARPRVIGAILLFVLGFSVVFVGLGAIASGFGQVLHAHRAGLEHAAGAMVVSMGALLVVISLPARLWHWLGSPMSSRVASLMRERRVRVHPGELGMAVAPVMGMAFAFAWTPCIGPVLGAVLSLAATRSTLVGGVLLLSAYSLGLGVPFVLFGLGAGRLIGRTRKVMWLAPVLQGAGGAILIAFGVLLLVGHIGWLSGQFSRLLNQMGLHRLTSS